MSGPRPNGDDRLERLYEQALGLRAAEREAFLDEACGDDPELRAELASLLAEGAGAETFMEDVGRLVEPSGEGPPNELVEALAGRYGIEERVGEGGMATVYRARDLRHERLVALKVLKPALAAVVGADRFLAEIKTTANLQHPHILPLYDSGEAEGYLFYVMPYMEGESLRQRLDREHQLPVAEAVDIVSKAAGALDYAHGHRVIHRDIKPANILLSETGEPLVSDFGIALAVRAGGGDRLTEPGLSLGTPHYMSPEQATGDQNIGPATDIYALGCVLYEMLVGEPPFQGSTSQAVLGKIITGEVPSAKADRASVPPHVDAVIAQSLVKVPADRFRQPADFRDALADPSFRYGPEASHELGAALRWRRGAILTAAGALFAVLGWAFEAARSDSAPPMVERYELTFPEGQAPTSRFAEDPVGNVAIALSPEGSTLAYVRDDPDGSRRLWLRPRDREEATPLRGSEGAQLPFFSPDGTKIGFLVTLPEYGIRVMGVGGGPPLSLVDGDGWAFYGASWSPDGHIYYIDGSLNLRRVPDVGGPSEAVLEPDGAGGVGAIGFPEAVPGGTGLLLTLQRGLGNDAGVESDSVAVLDLNTGQLRTLARGMRGLYLPPGYLVVVTSDGVVEALPFDERRLEVTGPGVPILSGLGRPDRASIMNMALSASGRLVYSDRRSGFSEAIWVDRSGRSVPADSGWTIDSEAVRLALSPDGRRVVVEMENNELLWMKELGGAFVRLPYGGGHPRWSPDGSEIIFSADTAGGVSYDLWSGSPDGVGDPSLLLDLDAPIAHGQREPNGDGLLVRTAIRPTGAKVLRASADGAVDTLLASETVQYLAPALSPDGRFLAYLSNESRNVEIYVRTYPAMDRGWRVSVGGGVEPVWSPDGRRLYYKSLPGAEGSRPWELVSVAFDPTDDVLERTTLFALPEGVVVHSPYFPRYAVAQDDERFLMIRAIRPGAQELSLHVWEGFVEEVRARLSR